MIKFSIRALLISTAVALVSGAPTYNPARRNVDPGLVPEFGHPAGLNPTGTGDCDGVTNAAGVVVKVPCFCPPDRASFIQSLNVNVAQGQAVNNTDVKISFPTDDSKASKLARIHATLVTLQNLRGKGVGCPAASTTLLAQQKVIEAGTDGAPAPAPSAPAQPNVPTPQPQVTLVDPTLVPEFGLASGLNPTGTGDCDGVTNAAGTVVKIPCFCPPDRTSFIQALSANVAQGQAVNNTVVKVSFPTDDSKASKLARLHTASVTLQNLRGPGIGCPVASTTFSAQQKAIEAGTDSSPVPAPAQPNTPAPNPQVSLVDPALVPEFGLAAGLNPTGTGDCDGVTNAAGVVVKIPCFCPPDRASFIQALSANVAQGRAVNNTAVNVSFPTDGSKASKLTRLNAASVTLQNLRGPGVGCPVAATTFSAQQKVIQDGP